VTIFTLWKAVANPQRRAFPGETFRVLKEKELRQFGEYRTRRLVVEAWERLKSSKTKSEAQ
jgi:hypothetical protein